jgi:hypothetical protein
MTKLLKTENCRDCPACLPTSVDGYEAYRCLWRDMLIPESVDVHAGVDPDCELPDAEPAPYSASNPPQVGDIVHISSDAKGGTYHVCGWEVSGDGAVLCIVHDLCGPHETVRAASQLTLLFRPKGTVPRR